MSRTTAVNLTGVVLLITATTLESLTVAVALGIVGGVLGFWGWWK